MLTFNQIDPKTGEHLKLPPKTAENTYLEIKLELSGRLEDPSLQLYTGKLYDGVTEADLIRLREEQGLHLLFSNARTAYFGDAQTCQLVDSELLQNFSDTVAYGSLPVSDGRASTLRTQRRVLVIDDEADPSDTSAVWGNNPILKQDGTAVDPIALQTAAATLGDSFGLVAPDLQRELITQETLETLANRVAIAQTLTLTAEGGEGGATRAEDEAGNTRDESGKTENSRLDVDAIAAQIRQELPERLWETAAVSDRLAAEVDYTDLFELEPLQVRPDGSAIAKWRYTVQDSDAPALEGKVLISQASESQYQFTVLGSTEAQQATVNQQFNNLVQSQNTPFQFRAGVPEWQGVIKGTCRASELCRELEVDAIIPKSAIKGDGKSTAVGLHTVEHLWWSRKAEAAVRQQKLGAQVLVNLPEGTRTDIEPKIQAELEKLRAAVADPRLVADLYCEKYERRQQLLAAQDFGDGQETDGAEAEVKEDWLYTVLKADARPTTVVNAIQSVELATSLRPERWQQIQAIAAEGLTVESFVEQANAVLDAEATASNETGIYQRFTVDEILNPVESDVTYPTTFSTIQRGGYSQLLEHDKVVKELNRFLQNEWRDLALGGIEVPSAMAQPHGILREDEVCFTELPHGAKVAIYRSPVANVSAFTVLTNNLDVIRESDTEALRQKGVVYLNPKTAKQQLIDFDGDTVAVIPELELQKVKPQVIEAQALTTLAETPANAVYVPGLADGQAVTLYHSGNQVSEYVNSTALASAVAESEAVKPLSQVYLPPTITVDLNQPVQLGYYDEAHGFAGLHAEITRLNLPENRPVQTEKEKKIPRNAYDPSIAKLPPEERAMAERFTNKERAALDAADNPTGLIANIGMRLEALRTEIPAIPDDQREAYLRAAVKGLKELRARLEPDQREPIVPPSTTKEGYDFVEALDRIAKGTALITAKDPQKRLEQVNAQLEQLDEFLFQVEGLNAINLQRGVDTPKSARTVNKDWQDFCRGAAYKEVAWVSDRKRDDIYLTEAKETREGESIVVTNALPNNTQDAVGRLVELTNAAFAADPLEYQKAKAYDHFLTLPPGATEVDIEQVKAQIQSYNSEIARASELEAKARSEEGPALQVKTQDGEIEITNLTRFDPEGKSPLWDAVRAGKQLQIKIVNNEKLSTGKSWQTENSHKYAVIAAIDDQSIGAIGTLSQESAAQLAEAALRREAPQELNAIKIRTKDRPQKEAEQELFFTLNHVTGGLDQRAPEAVTGKLTHSGDREEAKAIRQAANAERQEWSASIPPEDREYWARLAWSSQGQTFALGVFPDVVSKQAESFQFTQATVIGLQYEDWEGVDWSEPVTLRIAIGTEPVNPETSEPDKHYNRPLVQAQTEDGWKLVGTLNTSHSKSNQKDFQYPVGLIAEGTLRPQTDNRLIVTTEKGISLTVRTVEDSDLSPTVGDERKVVKFTSEGYGSRAKGYITDANGKRLGQLDKDSYQEILALEKRVGKIFNQDRRNSVTVAPVETPEPAKVGTLVLDPTTVQVPAIWSKHRAESWQKTLEQTGIEAGQITSEPGIQKVAPEPVQEQQSVAVQSDPQGKARPVKRTPSVSEPQPEALETTALPVPETETLDQAATNTSQPPELTSEPVPVTTSKPRPVKATRPTQEGATVGTATLETTPPPRQEPRPITVAASELEQRYQTAKERVVTVFQDAGQVPTNQQIDQAIAGAIYREAPDLPTAAQRLQVLAKSPVTQQLQQERGFEAASAYVNEVSLLAYQRVYATRTRPTNERNGNGRD